MTNNDFNKLSQSELLKGFDLSFENSKKLFESAEELSSKGFTSPAISLIILSAEEASKSIIFLYKLENPEVDFNIDIHQLFTYHDYKLSLLKDIYEALADSTLQFLKHMTKQTKEHFIEFDKFNKVFDKKIIELEKSNLNKITSWLETANSLKLKGLYLDYKKAKWVSPDSLTRKDYLECFEIVSLILMFLTTTELILNIKNNRIKKEKECHLI